MKRLEEHREEIETFIASMPRVSFKARIHVKDEEKIEMNDVLTYEIELERHHRVSFLLISSLINSSQSDSLMKNKKYGMFY